MKPNISTPALLGFVVCAVSIISSVALAAPKDTTAPKPDSLMLGNVPDIPMRIVDETHAYTQARSASFVRWLNDGSMIVTSRFGNVSQMHQVASPGAARTQITFGDEPARGLIPSPSEDMWIVMGDVGGGERWQVFIRKNGKEQLVSHNNGVNSNPIWSRDGSFIVYASAERDNGDYGIYISRASENFKEKKIATINNDGIWSMLDVSPDGNSVMISKMKSSRTIHLYRLDVAAEELLPVGKHKEDVICCSPLQFAPDGTAWGVSDIDSQFKNLGTVDIKTGKFTPVISEPNGNMMRFDISDDGKYLAYAYLENGMSHIKICDLASGRTREVPKLPKGAIFSEVEFNHDNQIGFSITGPKVSGDAYGSEPFSIDPESLKLTRWVHSESQVDPANNVEPELITIKSFDGEPMSGWLYRPDPKRHKGDRPLIVDIHGGPEGESMVVALGSDNYLINELGIAIFFPNVRGSTNQGKRFRDLDNGPWKRLDSVKDIGSFMDAVTALPGIDGNRVGVTGGSYGGFMCFAVSVEYSERLRGANCQVPFVNLVTAMERTSEFRRNHRRAEYGDERVPENRKKMLEVSPLFYADRIKHRMFVVAGANDLRTAPEEAADMVKEMRKNGVDVWHMVGKNEGHGFRKKNNQDYLFWASVLFWEQTLLGK